MESSSSKDIDQEEVLTVFRSLLAKNVALPVAAMNTLVSRMKVCTSHDNICSL